MAMELVSRKNSRGDVINWLTHDEDIALHHLSVPRDFIYGRQHCTTIWLNSGCALYGQSR